MTKDKVNSIIVFKNIN